MHTCHGIVLVHDLTNRKSCLNLDTCKVRSDLRLPNDQALVARIKQLCEEEREFCAVVVHACGQEKIVDVK